MCAVLGEFPWEKTGNLAGQGFLQGMAGISNESADLSKSPPPPPPPPPSKSYYGACLTALNLILPVSMD